MTAKLPALLVVWFLKISQLCEMLMQGQYYGREAEQRPYGGNKRTTLSDDPFLTRVLPHPLREATLGGHNFLANKRSHVENRISAMLAP